jgi:hypothetical protein
VTPAVHRASHRVAWCCYRKTFTRGTTVSLGPNGSTSAGMYTVAVTVP